MAERSFTSITTLLEKTIPASLTTTVGEYATFDVSGHDAWQAGVTPSLDLATSVDYKFEVSPDGTNWTTLSESWHGTDPADGQAAGTITNNTDLTEVIYYWVRPSVVNHAMAEFKELQMARYFRLNWINGIAGAVTPPDVTVTTRFIGVKEA